MTPEYAERTIDRVRTILRAHGIELTDALYGANFVKVCEAVARVFYRQSDDPRPEKAGPVTVAITVPDNVRLVVNGVPLLQDDDE